MKRIVSLCGFLLVVSVSLASANILTKGVSLDIKPFDFEKAGSLGVQLELPKGYILNFDTPSVVRLVSADGKTEITSHALTTPLADVSLKDLAKHKRAFVEATIFFCEEGDTRRCFLKKPRAEITHEPSTNTTPTLRILVDPIRGQ